MLGAAVLGQLDRRSASGDLEQDQAALVAAAGDRVRSDEKIRGLLLAKWQRMDALAPVFPVCDGSGWVPIVAKDPIPGVAAGGAVECLGCPTCRPEVPPALAVATHCGGKGLAVGCPVCGRRWAR